MKTKNVLAISTLIVVTVAVSILVAFSATASATPIQDAIKGEPYETMPIQEEEAVVGEPYEIAAMPIQEEEAIVDEPDEIEAMPYGDDGFVVGRNTKSRIETPVPAKENEVTVDDESRVKRPVPAKKNEVTVDDDKPADYSDIQTAIDNEPDGTKIKVMPGTYKGFVVDGRDDLKIEGKNKEGNAIVTGSVEVSTYRGNYMLTIGVVDSTKIEIKKLTVQAENTDPFTIAYFDSTGKVRENDISGNTGNANPGCGIAAFGISSPGTVKIEKNSVHDYGKIGILVNSWDGAASVPVPGGIYAEIKDNTIVGTDFADYNRVQDGIQVTYGGSAKIEKNEISGNVNSAGYQWTSDGILIYDAHEVTTNNNKIHDNGWGISIQRYVNYAKLEHDTLEDNSRGIYTYNWIASVIEVKHAKMKGNVYGWINWDTDGIVFNHCTLEKNTYGLYTSSVYTTNPTATFDHCKITKNTDYDVMQGINPNTLIFHKTKYDTYYNFGGGTLIES